VKTTGACDTFLELADADVRADQMIYAYASCVVYVSAGRQPWWHSNAIMGARSL
jgi:hypothetical protein